MDEAQSLIDHVWAGQYSRDYPIPQYLLLAPDSGFVYRAHYGCFPAPGNLGSIAQLKSGALRLRPLYSDPPPPWMSPRLDRQLVPIKWGPRRYLVAVCDLPSFGAAVRSGLEPRKEASGEYYLRHGDGKFYLRCGDEKLDVTGSPQAPDAFQSRLSQ